MIKYILVIKGVDDPEFQSIRSDLIEQYKAGGVEAPIITRLPQDYAEIEVVWIDEEMEKEALSKAIDKVTVPGPSLVALDEKGESG